MTESEITAELALVTTAIQNLLKTGSRYEVGTGPSRRVFEMAELPDLQALRASLSRKLLEVQDVSGFVGGF